MNYDPKTDKFPYPEDTDKHYLHVKKDDGTVFDKNYPYVDTSKKMLRKQKWTRVLLNLLVFPLSYIRMGLRVKGKENLKKYKDVIDKGVVSICNHVHMWDYIGIMNGVKQHKTYLLAWDKNVSGENGKMIRSVGGIPIPSGDLEATHAYLKAVKNLLQGGGWLHLYPEGSMWEYYAPIRPFKRGAAYLACENDKPVLPLAYSYRKPNWFRRVIFRQIALFTLHIGEPIFPDNSLSRTDRELDLTKRMHAAVCELAGIDPKENQYKPIHTHDKRVDYYTTIYGVGYKGSM